MSGEPSVFDIVRIVPTETTTSSGVEAPAYILQAGDTLTIKTYCRCGGSMVIRNAVRNAHLTCQYFFENLEAARAPTVKVLGGPISRLTQADIAQLTQPGEDLEGMPTNGDYYLSLDTAPITTSAAGDTGTLKPPTGETVGTWHVLTHVHGNAGEGVTAFDDNMLIVVQE